MLELTPAEIAELRFKIPAQSAKARQTGEPVINLILIGGPLDGLAVTIADDATSHRFVGWCVMTNDGPMTVTYERQGFRLTFVGIEAGQC